MHNAINNYNSQISPKFNKKDYYSNNYNSNFSVFSFKDAVPCSENCELYFKKIFNSNKAIKLSLLSYLEYNEVLNLKNVCKLNYKKIDKALIKDYIEQSGLTEFTRISFWFHNLPIEKIQEETKKQLEIFLTNNKQNLTNSTNLKNSINNKTNFNSKINTNKNLYFTIVKSAKDEIDKENPGNFKTVADEIGRDLNRTFHFGCFKSGEGQAKLGNILIAIAFVRPEVNYCQGMNFVAGALMEFFGEEIAFWIFLIFIDEYELNNLYSKNMPDYQIRTFQLEYLMQKFVPELYKHFKNNEINSDIFMSKFFLTIFAAFLPFEILCKLWDIFLIDKWKSIFKFIIVIISELEPKLLKMDLYEVSKFFRDVSGKETEFYKKIFKGYKAVKITNSHLEALKEDFYLEQIKSKLENPESEWETDQSEAYEIYKHNINQFDFDLQNEKGVILTKNQEIKAKYDAAKIEYNMQNKKCKFIKINLEEMIEKKSAFHNTLLILNNEVLSLSALIAQEKEKKKLICLNINVNKESKNNNNKALVEESKKSPPIPIKTSKHNNIPIASKNANKDVFKNKDKDEDKNKNRYVNISAVNNKENSVNNTCKIERSEDNNPEKKKKRSFFGFFSKEKKKPTANDKSEITSKQSKFNDTRSRSSIETKDTNSSRFLDTEGELIKINKKLNQILQLIETQNKSLLDNYSLLDSKKFILEKYKVEQYKNKKAVEEIQKNAEIKKRQMIKDLVDKLRLSEKFVKTQKF